MFGSRKFRQALRKKRNIDFRKWSEQLEKNDVLAMIIAGFIVIVPVILIAMGIICGIIWFFYFK